MKRCASSAAIPFEPARRRISKAGRSCASVDIAAETPLCLRTRPSDLACLRQGRAGNGSSEIPTRSAESQKRADQKVDGHGRIAAFHLRDAGLARMEKLREVCLAHIPLLPALPEAVRQTQAQFDVGSFFIR